MKVSSALCSSNVWDGLGPAAPRVQANIKTLYIFPPHLFFFMPVLSPPLFLHVVVPDLSFNVFMH